MRCPFRPSVLLACVVMLASATMSAENQSREKIPCDYFGAGCLPFACVPEDTVTPVRFLDSTAKYYCRDKCRGDGECRGGKCDTGTGRCTVQLKSTPPEPVRPVFFLNTVSVFLPWSGKPVVGAGFMNEIALSKTKLTPRPDGGWITRELSRNYFTWGLDASFAGQAQFFTGDLGYTRYCPGAILGITNLTGTAVYQRQGMEIWDLYSARNQDKIGAGIGVGFLKNIYVDVEALTPADEIGGEFYFPVSIRYMRDLVSDFIPDRFSKYLPPSLR